MSLEIFTLNDKNPNEGIGGSGCLCSPTCKPTECEGPYVVFHAAEMENRLSPYPVIGAKCLKAAAKKLLQVEQGKGEVLSAGTD